MTKIFFKKIISAVFLITIFFYCFIPAPTQASVFDSIKTNLGIFNQGAELPVNNDGLVAVVIKIINTALSFLALIFVCLILYAGFLYMTAGGETKKVEKAQNILKDSVIGLAIIFFAYIIMNFVFQQLDKVISTV